MAVSPFNVKQRQPYQRPFVVYTAAGAITQLQGGVAFLEGTSARAMTLAAPALSDDAVMIEIKAVTAQAHSVTIAGGVDGGGAASDLATFGTAKGYLRLVARAGVWYSLGSVDVTLS